MSVNLERVLNEIKGLSPEDLRILRDELNALLEPVHAQMSEEEFEQHLLAQGIISSIPTRDTDPAEYRNRKLIEVEGQPVSETLIEERR